MSKKYYAPELDGEMFYSKEGIRLLMEAYDYQEVEAYEGKIDYGSGFFYCTEYGTVGETFEGGCGISCEFYKPRNGKSGRCRFHKNTYEVTDKKVIIKKK